MLNGLDLFSGIGGLSLALGDWVRPLAYCERDAYAQGVLLSRMVDGYLEPAPIFTDVCDLTARHIRAPIDIIYGGFPCQDISSAGHGVGLGGERSGLFWHIARLVEEANPRFVFLENVAAIRTRGLNSVAQAFTELGYDFRWTILSAKEVGACHVRKRWFGLAHSNSERIRLEPGWCRREKRKAEAVDRGNGGPRAHSSTNGERLERERWGESRICRPASYNGWESQPTVCRGSDGVPHRVDRIKGLGNAVVPLQAKTAFMKLIGIEARDDV